MLRIVGELYSRINISSSMSSWYNACRICANVSAVRLSSHDSRVADSTGNTKDDTDMPLFDMPNPFEKENVQCILCKHKIVPDYKNIRLLSQFQSPYTGRIYGRHITGLCKQQQELVEKEIVKAQSAGLMPVNLKEPEFLRDPELFDVDKPLRPHRF